MKEEIQRINKLVAEGKLSPEDAADLIDAFYRGEETGAESNETPPPPPGEAYSGPSKPNDPFKSIIDAIEKVGKEVTENVDWKQVSDSARENARKGLDALKSGLDDISKGKFNLGWLLSSQTREIQLPLTFTEGQVLKVENGCGNIRIVNDSSQSYVKAKARVRGATPEDAKAKAELYTLMVESSDHAVEIKQPNVSGLEVDLEIHLASSPAIEIKSEAGDVSVENTANSVRLKSTDGSIKLVGLKGQIDVDALTGDVHVADSEASNVVIENKAGNIVLNKVTGSLNLRSASGNISVFESNGKTIAAEAVSGNISIDLSEPMSGSVNIRTVNGNAHLSVADGSDARVSITTLRGIASTEIELKDRAQNDQRITGVLGEGNGTFDISAVNGNVGIGLRQLV